MENIENLLDLTKQEKQSYILQKQIETLDVLFSHNAISEAQYDKGVMILKKRLQGSNN